jgi:exodeoxyribonuclease VII small subunit
MSKAKRTTALDFEATFAELNQIVEQMEQGGLKLEDALQNFERGISLIRNCQAALKAAEQKVQVLIEQNGQTSLAAFEMEDNE